MGQVIQPLLLKQFGMFGTASHPRGGTPDMCKSVSHSTCPGTLGLTNGEMQMQHGQDRRTIQTIILDRADC